MSSKARILNNIKHAKARRKVKEYYWQQKIFNTYQEQQDFINDIKDAYQYEILFINNGYCVEYKKKFRMM